MNEVDRSDVRARLADINKASEAKRSETLRGADQCSNAGYATGTACEANSNTIGSAVPTDPVYAMGALTQRLYERQQYHQKRVSLLQELMQLASFRSDMPYYAQQALLNLLETTLAHI